MSRPLDWISYGSLSVLTALLVVAASLSACDEEQALTLRPAELVDPAPTDPFDLDPLLAAPPIECEECTLQRIELPGGDVVTVRIDRSATLRLAPDRIESIELAVEGTGTGEAAEGLERYSVHALLDEAGREAWRGFAVKHARRFVLVEIGERPVDLVRPLGWARGLRIGVFEDEAARAAFVRALPFGRGAARGARAGRDAGAARGTRDARGAERAP